MYLETLMEIQVALVSRRTKPIEANLGQQLPIVRREQDTLNDNSWQFHKPMVYNVDIGWMHSQGCFAEFAANTTAKRAIS